MTFGYGACALDYGKVWLRRLNLVVMLAAIGLTLNLSGGHVSAQSTYAGTCQDGTETVLASAYSNGWLLCDNSDQYQGSEQVYQETPVGSGNFVFVKGSGGAYLPADLVQFAGVDPADAEVLVNEVAAQIGDYRNFGGGARQPKSVRRHV